MLKKIYMKMTHIFWSYTKEIGLNMTPLISKFVPFNFVETKLSTVGFKYKKYFSFLALIMDLGIRNIHPLKI